MKLKGIDFLDISNHFNEDELMVQHTAREFVNNEILPIIEEHFENATFPDHLVKKFAEMGFFGMNLPEKYNCAGMSNIAYGLVCQELERGDSSIRVLSSVQSLVMNTIYSLGSDDQKQKYLPKLASGELIGSFGMSEPNHGSDPSSMKSHYSEEKDCYIVNGSKMWIGHAPICDVAVIWAKSKSNKYAGFIVERSTEGFSTAKIEKKWSFRASETGELIFQNMKVPKDNILTETDNIKILFDRLNIGRFGVAWGSLGIAMECYDVALRYSNERNQFGKSISSYQLVQQKLVKMVTEITKSQILTWRLGLLMDNGNASFEQISLAKKVNVEMACEVAKISRSILGGMGITGEYPIMRHINNLEALVTYQGTDEIHTLIIGKKITGVSAIK